MSAKIGTWQKVTWYKFLQTLFQGPKSSEVQNLLQLFVSLVCIHSDSQVMFLMTDSFSFSPSDRSQLHLCLQTTPISFWRHHLCLHHVVMNTWGFLYQELCHIQDMQCRMFQKVISKTFSCHSSFCTEGHTVAMVAFCVVKMLPCWSVVRQFFDTMIIASSYKERLYWPIKYKCWKLFEPPQGPGSWPGRHDLSLPVLCYWVFGSVPLL